MIKASYEVEVLVNGKPLKEYAHDGKVYIEGREKTVFSLRLRNNSYSRKLFIPTIDGLSVMDGKEASYKSSGYIVRGNSSLTVEGWRVSDSKVAEFYFSEPGDSYRKRMKKGNNLGVIGCAVFDEKQQNVNFVPLVIQQPFFPKPFGCTCPWYCHAHSNGAWYTTTTCGGISGTFTAAGTSNSAYTANLSTDNGLASLSVSNSASYGKRSMEQKSQAQQALGTGWGQQKKNEVVTVEFDQKDSPAEVFELFYNTREQLEKIGIDFHREPHYVTPVAFPGQYCEPPQN